MDLKIPEYKKIAIALDFTSNDEKLIAYAIGQGKKQASYLLIHVVESASARLLGSESDDYETHTDLKRLQQYADVLHDKGYSAEASLGFHQRSKEIVRIVNEQKANLLVIGAHGHTGIKDWIYGETIEAVRHELKVPILIVNL